MDMVEFRHTEDNFLPDMKDYSLDILHHKDMVVGEVVAEVEEVALPDILHRFVQNFLSKSVHTQFYLHFVYKYTLYNTHLLLKSDNNQCQHI